MPASDSRLYRFGPFSLDAGRRRLTRGDVLVTLPNRQIDVLLVLTSHAGHLVSKDMLSETVWAGVAVTDNSIVQAVKGLREVLGAQADGAPYIDSQKGKGYRFVARVERDQPVSAVVTAASITDLLEPYGAFVDGRAALETLDNSAVRRAREAFAAALHRDSTFPAAHIGMANACVLAFESTRADVEPDRGALADADRHALQGCALDPSSGDAWSTLAVVRHRCGHTRDAIAAARKAVALEPQEWRHYLRLASVSWGGERLRAAHRVLQLCPGLALGHWFAATVFVAREALDIAMEHIRAGCAAQDAQHNEGERFTGVGLHLLHGLVLAARRWEGAGEELTRELAFEQSGHIYARECCANTWYALGALALRSGQRDESCASFKEALIRVPDHPLASAGLAAATGEKLPSPSTVTTEDSKMTSIDIDTATVLAVRLAVQDRHAEAARICGEALHHHGEPSQAGWLLPVEPLLHVAGHRAAWTPVLTTLRARAA